MRVVIADCAISKVPLSWRSNKKIAQHYRKYNRWPIIDGSSHQHLMEKIPKEERLDRPDILHFGLLTLLGYKDFLENLEVLFGIGENYYRISPEARLPRSQTRFYGLVEHFLEKPGGNPFITNKSDFEFDHMDSIYFSSRGRPMAEKDLTNSCFVFGGFAYGDFRSIDPPEDRLVSLHPEKLDLWTAISHFLNRHIEFHDYINST